MSEHKSRITGRIEEWWKKACIEHNCKYYIHEDYPKCSYCTCPDNCILVDKPKRDTEAVEKFVESDAFKKLMESLDEQDRADKEDAEQFLRDIKEQE